MRLVVLGRQGAGKGTQCKRLAERLGVVHIATGDAFRAAMAAQSGLGRRVAAFVAAGELVPDDLAVGVVAEELSRAAVVEQGFVLDGFPRTVRQAQRLDALLAPVGIDAVLDLRVQTDVVLRRLLNRRVCGGCGYVAAAVPSSTGSVLCAGCGGTFTRRADDTEPLIRRRLAIYEEQVGPVLSWYASRGTLRTVDGNGPEAAVSRRVEAALLLGSAHDEERSPLARDSFEPQALTTVLDLDLDLDLDLERAVDVGSLG